jgi:hypothetical protein
MTSRLETGMERLRDRMLSRGGKTVTLQRGSQTTSGVTALLGTQLLKVTDSDGNPQTIRTDKDFLISRTDYQFGSVAVEPLRQDKILETIDGTTATYELLPYGDEPIYRWADEFRKVYRIHTKRIK